MARRVVIALAAAATLAGCDLNTALEQVGEARAVTSELIVQFTKTVEASNRAVMANTDDVARSAAEDAARAVGVVERDATTLRTLFDELKFTDEAARLGTFATRFAEYKAVHQRVVDLAIEGTNLKAEQLAYGPASTAADALRDALAGLKSTEANQWRIEALAAQVVGAAREIQALHAPHIQEAGDEAMTRIEGRMSTAVETARHGLADLTKLVAAGSRPNVTEASRQLDRFLTLHGEILKLSRQNTNVRSLALALDERRRLAEACETDLRALQTALAKRGFVGTR